MKRGFLVFAGLGLIAAGIRCLVRGHHEPRRHPLGGYKCERCQAAGADLHDMGFPGEAYVSPTRRLFSRAHEEITTTSHYDPSGRGTH